MTNAYGHWPGDPHNRSIKFKLIDTDPVTGEQVWAQIVSLEPDSIGGGGGGGGLTDAQLRAADVKITLDGEVVPVTGTFWQATQPVSGPLTDAQLRASAVPVDVTPGAPAAGDYLPVRLTDGTSFYVAGGGSGGGDGAILDGVTPTIKATVTASNALKVDGSAVTQPVSGPLTDAQLRAASVPISDGGGSITVDGTFWQATQPVSIATTVQVDVVDEATRELGRARIWDGTDEATVLPVRTQPATTEKALNTVVLPYRQATYGTTTIAIAPAITVGVKELLALWHASTGTKDIYITEIAVAGLVTTASTAGRSTLRVSTITAAPTGGTEEAKVDLTGAGASDMTNTMRVKTGGGTIGSTFIRKAVWGATQAVNSRVSESLFKVDDVREAIILRQGSNAGISIDIEREVAHTALVDQWYVTVRWLEL